MDEAPAFFESIKPNSASMKFPDRLGLLALQVKATSVASWHRSIFPSLPERNFLPTSWRVYNVGGLSNASSNSIAQTIHTRRDICPVMITHLLARRGFTLVEMLTVMAIIVVLLTILAPVVTSVSTSRTLANAGGDIASTLEQARTYAMANNTYVYVGFFEADATQSAGLRPQSPGTGRVYVGAIATRDGTNGYSTEIWTTSNMVDLNKPQRFDGVHFTGADITKALTTMDQNLSKTDVVLFPSSGSSGSSELYESSVLSFNAPSQATTGKICTFNQVIQFAPTGGAKIITSTTGSLQQVPYFQFGLLPAHGNQASSQATVSTPDCAGIQIDGLTGVIRLYRAGQK